MCTYCCQNITPLSQLLADYHYCYSLISSHLLPMMPLINFCVYIISLLLSHIISHPNFCLNPVVIYPLCCPNSMVLYLTSCSN